MSGEKEQDWQGGRRASVGRDARDSQGIGTGSTPTSCSPAKRHLADTLGRGQHCRGESSLCSVSAPHHTASVTAAKRAGPAHWPLICTWRGGTNLRQSGGQADRQGTGEQSRPSQEASPRAGTRSVRKKVRSRAQVKLTMKLFTRQRDVTRLGELPV
jgi:hypothetical protein